MAIFPFGRDQICLVTQMLHIWKKKQFQMRMKTICYILIRKIFLYWNWFCAGIDSNTNGVHQFLPIFLEATLEVYITLSLYVWRQFLRPIWRTIHICYMRKYVCLCACTFPWGPTEEEKVNKNSKFNEINKIIILFCFIMGISTKHSWYQFTKCT